MIKKILSLVILVMLVSVVSAQASWPSCGKPDFTLNPLRNHPMEALSYDGELSPEQQAQFNKELIFTQLEYNSQSCYPDCTATFRVHNSLDVDIPKDNLQVEFYQPDLSDVSGSIDTYDISLAPTTQDDQVDYIPAGSDKEVTITGTKNEDVAVEWQPVLGIKQTDYPSLEVPAVMVRQNSWALWDKGPQPIQPDLVAGYHMDESSGNIADFSGYGNTGTNKISGTYSKLAVFSTGINISTGNFSVQHSGGLAFGTKNLSISLWYKSNSLVKSGEFFVSKYNVSSNCQIGFGTRTTGFIDFEIYNQSGSYLYAYGNTNVIDQNWHHIVGVYYPPSGLDIYVDNVLNSHTSGGGGVSGSITNYNPLVIGSLSDGSQPVNGTLDEILIFNRSLSTVEITNLYEAGITQVNITSPLDGTTFNSNYNTDTINVSGIVGLPDQSTQSAIYYTNSSGTQLQLRTNGGDETNYTYIKLTRLNSTHFWVNATEHTGLGTYSVTLRGYGGNDLVTSAVKTISFTTQATPHTPITFGTYSVGSTYAYVGSSIPVTITYTNPSSIQDKVYVKSGPAYSINIDSNSITNAGVSSTSFNWDTQNSEPITLVTKGCVNDTWNTEYCSLNSINVQFYSTTTTLEAPPYIGVPITNATGGMVARPCFSHLMDTNGFNFLQAVLCPFLRAFGGS